MKYEELEMQIVSFDADDVIVTSTGGTKLPIDEDP